MAVCGSAFKPALALCLLQVLHSVGSDPDEPLANLGVELADPRTTGRHAIEHQAGLPQIRDIAPDPRGLSDESGITSALRRTAPLWQPGIRTAYHAVSYGYLLQAICEDLIDEPMVDLLWARVLGPAGIGHQQVTLPSSEASDSRVEDVFVEGRSPIPWRPQGRSLIYRALYALPDLVAHLNSPAGKACPPLSCGVPCTAEALATLYSALIAPTSGHTGYPEEVRSAMFARSEPAFDQVMRQRLTWSGGMLVGAGLRALMEQRANLVGLPGYGGSLGLGDPDTGVSVGVISTRLDADRIVGRDCETICEALLDALAA